MTSRQYLFVVLFFLSAGARGLTLAQPQFQLKLDSPTEITGEPGEPVDFTATAQLASAGIVTSDGVEGWSIGISSDAFVIASATTAGTSGAEVADGGLRLNDGFEKTQLTTGAGNTGVTSAVVLSTGTNVTLPPVGTANLLRLTVRAIVPNPIVSGGQYQCRPLSGSIVFVNGLRGSGQPVQNKVSVNGIDFRPSLGKATVSVCPRLDQPSFALSVGAPLSVQGQAGELQRYDASVQLATSPNSLADGAEGWSISLGSQGSKIIAATTDGTAGALKTAGGFRLADGFERTEITSGVGNEGVVSAVTISTGGGSTLPPAGELTLLKLTIEAQVPQPIVSGGKFTCVPKSSDVFFVDGRKGSGQPVKNRVSVRGLGLHPSQLNRVTSICPVIQTPVYTFAITAPASTTGAAGATIQYEAMCRLTSSNNPGPDGAEGWSLGVAAQGAKIVRATTAGTLGALASEGGLRQPDGFEKTELTTGAGNEGVVCALVLSGAGSATLPPAGAANLLRLTVETTVPQPVRGPAGEEICFPNIARVFCRDGLDGSGQPVKNKVGYRGLSYVPALRESATSVCPPLTNPFLMTVDVVAPEATREADSGSTIPWRVDVPVGSGAIAVTTGIYLKSDLEGREDGARSWSFSLKTAECFDLLSATTAGTAVETYSSGGFEKTELVDPARNGGEHGLVSAVVLSQQAAKWLPPISHELLLKATGAIDASGITVPGESTEACPVSLSTPGTPGLRGAGEPVETVVTVFNPSSRVNESRSPAVSAAAIRLVGVEGLGQFRRGDANDDGLVNLSDAVWILEFLFRGGRPTTCRDAADVDNNGKQDITDPIFLLGFLFLGSRSPPPPGVAACGADPEGDSDGMDCQTPQSRC